MCPPFCQMTNKQTIKDLPKIERPREKLMQYGPGRFSNTELLALILRSAVKNLAAQVILAHNHPSGDPEPSEDDLEINKRLVEAGKILGIEVIDHIIVAKNGYLSFKEKELV